MIGSQFYKSSKKFLLMVSTLSCDLLGKTNEVVYTLLQSEPKCRLEIKSTADI